MVCRPAHSWVACAFVVVAAAAVDSVARSWALAHRGRMPTTHPAREDSNTPPPAVVLRAFKRFGVEEVQLPQRASWWRSPGGLPGSWEETLDALLGELEKRRTVDARGPKRFWLTSEFWMASTTMLGLAGGATAVLTGWGLTLQEPWRELVGGAMATATALIPRAYRFARERAKQLAELEREKSLRPADSEVQDGVVP